MRQKKWGQGKKKNGDKQEISKKIADLISIVLIITLNLHHLNCQS